MCSVHEYTNNEGQENYAIEILGTISGGLLFDGGVKRLSGCHNGQYLRGCMYFKSLLKWNLKKQDGKSHTCEQNYCNFYQHATPKWVRKNGHHWMKEMIEDDGMNIVIHKSYLYVTYLRNHSIV